MIFKLVLAFMLAVKLVATALAQERKVWFGRPHRSMIAEGRTAAMGGDCRNLNILLLISWGNVSKSFESRSEFPRRMSAVIG